MTLEDVLKSGNYYLIDVREPLELEMDGEIEGAENIPLGEIEAHATEILKIEKPVVVFCRSGGRSGKALEFLDAQGLKNGYNGGGMQALKNIIDSL